MQKKNHLPVGIFSKAIVACKKNLRVKKTSAAILFPSFRICLKWSVNCLAVCLLALVLPAKSVAQQFCNPSVIYDEVTSAYHSSFARLANGSFVIWGEQTGPTTTNADLLSPTAVTPANGFNYTGSPLLMAMGSTWEEPQVILLTSTHLYAWGTENLVIPTAITTNDAFQSITPTGANSYGLPGTLTPADIAYMTASHQVLAIQTNTGDVYTLGSRYQAYGDGTTVTNNAWHQVKLNSTTNLTNVVHMRITYKGGFAITSTNAWYTWGDESLLANGSASVDRRFATAMTVPADFTSASQVKMIQVGSKNTTTDLMAYYALHTNGKIYVVGENTTGQMGVGNYTDQLNWTNVVQPGTGTAALTNVRLISANESDDHYGAAGAVLNNGTVYTWGDNSYGMIGHNQTITTLNRPTIPNGFTVGTDIATFMEVGGHSTIIVKQGSSRYCYIGHRVFGSMGDGTSIDDVEVDFNCTNTGTIDICAATSFDAGDVPASYENGNYATHLLTTNPLTLRLGATFPTANNNNIVNVAAGADNNGSNGDGTEEDGITTLPAYTRNGTYSVTVNTVNNTGANANLYAWIDWNNDGKFSSSEILVRSVGTGTANVTLTWSGLPTSGLNSKLYMRTRITSAGLTDDISTTNIDERSTGVASNGEVEDYQLAVTNLISGTVWNDVNGNLLIDGLEAGTNAGNTVFVNLIDGGNNIVRSVAVATNGTYSIGAPQSVSGYKLVLTTTSFSSSPQLPGGWVNTGENVGSGNTAAQSATPGSIDLTTGTTDISGQNFGIEQLPTAGSGTQNAGNNPGRTSQVTVNASTFTNTTASSDPSPGAVTGLRITSFPVNATSIVINGTSYTSATFPVAGVTVTTDASGNPAQTITVDPLFNGSGTVTISFVVRDAAGMESSNTGTAAINFTTYISGNIYNDFNGLSDNTVNGTIINPGNLISAVLVNNTTGLVAASAVATGGTYTFSGLTNGNYSVRITTTAAAVGSAPPAVTLPSGWVRTGEIVGFISGSDGTVDGILNLGTITAFVNNVNFGIEQPPAAGSGTQSAGTNPGGTTQVTVNPSAFTNTTASSDPLPGAVTGLRITSFPVNATSIVINGTSYTSATFPVAGVTVTADASGNPAQTVTVDPSFNGSGAVTISFVARDAAGMESSNTGAAAISFTTAISGNILYDANGLSDNTVNGPSVNPGDVINAVLVNNTTGLVVASTVATGGNYTFTGLTNGNYSVRITTLAATVGSLPPAVSGPATWVNTGENTGTAAGNDGTPDGILDIGNITGVVTSANFGIDERPAAGSGNYNAGTNPGGTIQVTINAGAFTTITPSSDPAPGAVTSIRITTFPANTTSMVINGTSYTSATFPATGIIVTTDVNGNPGQAITVDPSFNGSGTITISFVARDAANVESANTGIATVSLFNAVAGNVYNDTNGLTDNIVNGSGTNAGNTLNAILVNTATNLVTALSSVSSSGTYNFTGLADGSYAVRITTNTSAVGSAPPVVTLPAGWVNTGENLGSGTGSDGTTNGILSIGTINSTVSNANFGIEQPPTAGSGTQTGINNTGSTAQFTVNAGTFTNVATSSDPAPGAVTAIRITTFPANTTSMVINGTSYTSATFPAAGVIVTADANGNPTQTITVDPSFNGSGSVSIRFVARDGAGFQSSNEGTATLSFNLTISGNVYNDVNGLTDNMINGTGTNAGNTINAVLMNTASNTVIAATAVSGSGAFSFAGLTNNAYSVRITTAAATIGAAPPAVTLPSGWVNTGENFGAGTGSDGTADGILSLGNVTAQALNANFGIANCLASGTSSPNATAGVNKGVYCAQSLPSAIQLNASATGGISPYTYAWAGSGVTNANLQNTTANPTTTGSFTVTVTDAIGCKGSAITGAVIYDNTLPSIAWSCGSTPNNWLRLMENNGYSWKWTTTSGGRFYTSNTYSTADDNATSNMRMPYINKAGQYTVQITSINGCTSTGSINMSPTPVSCSIVLPDESIDLNAAWSGNSVLLKWSTAIPNVTGFTIERSTDAVNFTAISEVRADQSAAYSYTDANIPAPCTAIWFRIKTTDIFGKTVLSKAVMLTCKQLQAGSILVMPNPVTGGHFTINYKLPVAGTINYELFNINGQRLLNGVLENVRANETGSKTIILPAGTARGAYIIRLLNTQWASKPLKIIVTD